jgi:UDP-N-acetylglucosamine 4,6-dehydratase
MRRIGITGLSGSLGTALAEYFSRENIVVGMSRDELKAEKIAARYGAMAGNVRCMVVAAGLDDPEAMARVYDGCDVLIHTAALKRISGSVYATQELIKTNVIGTINVLRMARELRISKVVVISSDKAVCAQNLYGASKFCAECAAVQENAWSWPKGTSVLVVRYGNVLGSRGSVIHLWRAQLAQGRDITITDHSMTRFILTLSQAVRIVRDALDTGEAGEILVPALPSVDILTLAQAVAQEAGHTIKTSTIGLRPGGEKLAEELLSPEEIGRTYRHSSGMWAVAPAHRTWTDQPYSHVELYSKKNYSSHTAPRLTLDDLVALLKDIPVRPPND